MKTKVKYFESPKFSGEGPEVWTSQSEAWSENIRKSSPNDFLTMLLCSPAQSATLDNRSSAFSHYVNAIKIQNCAIQPLPLPSWKLPFDMQPADQQLFNNISAQKLYQEECNFPYINGTEMAQFSPPSHNPSFGRPMIPLTDSHSQNSTLVSCPSNHRARHITHFGGLPISG